MAKQRKTKKASPPIKPSADEKEKDTLADRIEFHRHAVALMPEAHDMKPGMAAMLLSDKLSLSYRGCSCNQLKSKTCRHIKDLTKAISAYRKRQADIGLYNEFRASKWYLLAELLCDESKIAWNVVQIVETDSKDTSYLKIMDQQGQELMSYYASSGDKSRFIGRLSNQNG